jgi:hypothetical protein
MHKLQSTKSNEFLVGLARCSGSAVHGNREQLTQPLAQRLKSNGDALRAKPTSSTSISTTAVCDRQPQKQSQDSTVLPRTAEDSSTSRISDKLPQESAHAAKESRSPVASASDTREIGIQCLASAIRGAACAKGEPAESPKTEATNEEMQVVAKFCEKSDGYEASEGQVMQQKESINIHTGDLPAVKLALPSDYQLTVAMSVIESPGRFWVHLVNEEVERIDWLHERLLNYAALQNTAARESVTVQMYETCCTRSHVDGSLYRAQIIGLCFGHENCQRTAVSNGTQQQCSCKSLQLPSEDESSSVKAVWVLFVDFGNREWTDPLNLLPLPEELRRFPPMAVCCRLAGIEPSASNSESAEVTKWSKEAVEYFTSLVGFDKLLWANIDTLLLPGSVISYVTTLLLLLILKSKIENF